MKRWFALILMAMSAVAFAADSNTEILKRIEELRQASQAQQRQIDALQRQLQSSGQTRERIRQEVDAAFKAQKVEIGNSRPVITLGKNIEGLRLKGDLRIRYEQRQIDPESSSSEDTVQKRRFRHRVRLGGVWENPSENWEIGLGLEAGSSSGKSANDSWNSESVWDSGSVYLDYAYARHTLGLGLSATVGQQKNPFKSTFLMFDGDLRPTGATLQYKSDLVFATVGAYNLRGDARASGDNQTLANMYAAQIGLAMKAERVSGLLAIGYWHYDSETTEHQISTAAQTANYQYRIGAVHGELTGKAGPIGWKIHGETAMNFGADSAVSQGHGGSVGSGYESEENNLAWMLGIQAKINRIKIKYAYARIEGDAVPWFVSDSDFGAAIPGHDTSVNVQGHKLGLEYRVTDHCSVAGSAFFTELISAADDANGDAQLYQIDLKYKF